MPDYARDGIVTIAGLRDLSATLRAAKRRLKAFTSPSPAHQEHRLWTTVLVCVSEAIDAAEEAATCARQGATVLAAVDDEVKDALDPTGLRAAAQVGGDVQLPLFQED